MTVPQHDDCTEMRTKYQSSTQKFTAKLPKHLQRNANPVSCIDCITLLLAMGIAPH